MEMTRAFGQLFWGFFFVMLSFRINRFDILPDVVGYILIFLGTGALAMHNDRFRAAKNASIPLMVLAGIDFIASLGGTSPQRGGIDVPLSNAIGLAVILGIATLVLSLLMAYNVCMGIADMAGERGLTDLQREARSRWYLYLAVTIGGFLFLLMALAAVRSGNTAGLGALFLLFFIFVIIAAILFLIMLRRAQNQVPKTPLPGVQPA